MNAKNREMGQEQDIIYHEYLYNEKGKYKNESSSKFQKLKE